MREEFENEEGVDSQEDDDQDQEPNLNQPKLFDMRIGKGRLGELQVNIWDKVRDCPGKMCGLFDTCPYFQTKPKIRKAEKADEKGIRSLGPCQVEQKYITTNLKPFWGLLNKVPDDFVMQFVGMHLIPLYLDLVQFKIEKAKLKEVVYTDAKGSKKVHPVYDHILKIHKEIIALWKSSGLLQIAKDVGFFKAGGTITPSDDDLEMNGDPGAYEQMSKGV